MKKECKTMKYFMRTLAVLSVFAAILLGCKTNVSSDSVAVTSVTLNKSEVTLEQGTSEKLTETVLPAEATNKKVTWSSGNTTVATVGQDGTVQAKTAGEAIITVTSEDGGKTATCKVTVKAKADGVTETTTSPISVEKDKTVTFTAVPEGDYAVDKWSVTPIGALQTGGTDGSSTATVKITEATEVKVTFKPVAPPAPLDKTYTVEGISFTMKGIAAVTNGSVGDNSQSYNNVHKVSLTAYLIEETEVTQELWQKVMGNNPSNFTDSLKNPVEKVSWYECIAFCNELTKKVAELGESRCVYTVDGHTYGTADAAAEKVPDMDMSKNGFRLPTEAEWEWAAMGGTTDKWAGTNTEGELANYAWYNANSNYRTHEVKKKQANGYGLYDMSGNVWEWCWNRYSSTPTGGKDPLGADSGSYRVWRGGSGGDDADRAARAYRGIVSYPVLSIDFLGLRVACRP